MKRDPAKGSIPNSIQKPVFLQHIFAAVVGTFVALAMLKFGNPVILESQITRPSGFWEYVYQPWPILWGYCALTIVFIGGLLIGRWKKIDWPMVLLFVWLVWQFVSATRTVSPELTALTLKHFTACVVCFFLGWFALAEVENLTFLWVGILISFFWTLRVGFEQHFGGLEETRRMFRIYVLPTLQNPPIELLKKMETNRIFSTFFYPNTFAGAILLFLPISLGAIWDLGRRLMFYSRVAAAFFVVAAALACLYWTGSKSGWLLMLVLGLIAGWRLPISKRAKQVMLGLLLMGGMVGFFVKYAGFFQRGATSVAARFDYWNAAVEIAGENPLLGTGPGTFSVPYAAIKPPEAEMARLCHNDYLEQACDSGVLGFLTYFAFLGGVFWRLYRHRGSFFWMTIGLLGVACQSFSDFNLYIPALAWTSFLLLGFLTGRARNQLDKETTAG